MSGISLPHLLHNGRSAILGEGLFWDDKTGRLFWVDIPGKAICSYRPADGSESVCSLPDIVSFAIPCSDGAVIAGINGAICRVDLLTGELQKIAAPRMPVPGRFNDAKCDPSGRLWAGSMSLTSPPAPDAALYRLDAGKLRKMESGFMIANGIGWSPDGGTMYVTDTGRSLIWQYDYDLERGKALNRRVFTQRDGAKPDGLCVDQEGYVYSAQFGEGCVDVYDPQAGRKERILIPVPQVTSCCFGGDDLRTLFITTARDGMTPAQMAQAPLSGRIFAISRKVAGLPSVRARF